MLSWKQIRELWTLPKEEEETDTYREIQEGIVFHGHNLWLLAIAMVIACIGLNAGNNAAIIGAMLISPLMGPVIGFAFGLSIHSTSMMRLSVRNWGIMVTTSLLASSVYFFITPFHHSTVELESFTKATIFDVMLAFAGGIAGFTGIIRKEAIKVIAGVAVATACIPPLCTAGYGLANAEWTYLAGGLYFFLINCFFIGLGTWCTSTLLGYKGMFSPGRKQKSRMSFWMTTAGLALLAPSIWLALQKWTQEQHLAKASHYVEAIKQQFPELVIIQHQAFAKNGKRFVEISLLNDSADVAGRILQKANNMDTTMEIIWHFAPDKASRETIQLKAQVALLDSMVKKQDSIIQTLMTTSK